MPNRRTKKKQFLVHMPEHMHHLLSFVADDQGRTMADLAREAIWAAIAIHVEEMEAGGRALEGVEASCWAAGDPTAREPRRDRQDRSSRLWDGA